METKKYILCFDYNLEYDLRGARLLDPDTLRPVVETELGAWLSNAAVLKALAERAAERGL